MDETTELLKAVLFRLEELSAKIDGMDKRLGGVENHMEETNRRLSMIEQRLDYYRDKWMEHDEEIWVLKRRQA